MHLPLKPTLPTLNLLTLPLWALMPRQTHLNPTRKPFGTRFLPRNPPSRLHTPRIEPRAVQEGAVLVWALSEDVERVAMFLVAEHVNEFLRGGDGAVQSLVFVVYLDGW